jgi:hypothetical protein
MFSPKPYMDVFTGGPEKGSGPPQAGPSTSAASLMRLLNVQERRQDAGDKLQFS